MLGLDRSQPAPYCPGQSLAPAGPEEAVAISRGQAGTTTLTETLAGLPLALQPNR